MSQRVLVLQYRLTLLYIHMIDARNFFKRRYNSLTVKWVSVLARLFSERTQGIAIALASVTPSLPSA